MRIAIVTGEYAPLEGGVGDFTRELSRALATAGHELHILTNTGDPPGSTTEGALTIHRLIPDWGWKAPSRVVSWIREIKPDAVNLQYQAAIYEMGAPMPLFTRRMQGRLSAPIVTTFHDLLPPYLFPKAGPLRHWVVRQLARYSRGVIVTNEADYTAITEALPPKQPPVRLIAIGSNIPDQPPAGYDRLAWRAHHGLGPHDLLIGYFGFLNRNKGVETLLEALARLVAAGRPAHLIFIGGRTGSSDSTNARYAEEIDALADRLGLTERIHRTGYAEPAEISAALLATDLCALPYRNGANLRHGTLHACLAHGRPIVTTTPQTPTPELKSGENILLVPPDDPSALAQAIRQLESDPALAARLGQNAALLSREFSWEGIAARTAEFFRFLIERQK